jgi:signal transduction histidine kinase
VEQSIGGTPLRLEFQVTGMPRRCPPRVEEQLLRIGQEAVSNVVRHAQASAVRVELAYDDGSVVLRVVDDGRGFDPHESGSHDHWGVTMMHERAQMIGARLEVVSHPGRGTEVEVVVSLVSDADDKRADGARHWPSRAPLTTREGVPNA